MSVRASSDRPEGENAARRGSCGMPRMNGCVLGSGWPTFLVFLCRWEEGHFSFRPPHIPVFAVLFSQPDFIAKVVMELPGQLPGAWATCEPHPLASFLKAVDKFHDFILFYWHGIISQTLNIFSRKNSSLSGFPETVPKAIRGCWKCDSAFLQVVWIFMICGSLTIEYCEQVDPMASVRPPVAWSTCCVWWNISVHPLVVNVNARAGLTKGPS